MAILTDEVSVNGVAGDRARLMVLVWRQQGVHSQSIK